MISSGMKNYPLYIGEIIQERDIPILTSQYFMEW